MMKNNIIFDYYRREIKLLTVFIIFNILVTGLDLLAPLVVKNIIDIAIPSKNIAKIFNLSILVLVIYFIRTGFAIISFSRGQLMGNKIKYHMRNDLFSHILNKSYIFFDESEKGDLIARLTSDLENSSSLLYRGLQDLISAGGALIGGFILMCIYSPSLAFFTFLPLPLGFVFVYSKNRKMKKGYREIRRKNSKFTSSIYEIFRVIFFIKDNSLEDYAKNKFLEKNKELLEVEKNNFLNVGIFMSGVTFYVHLTQIILIGAGGYLYSNNKITIGIIISFLLLVDRFKISLIKISGLTDLYHKGMSGINRFKEMFSSDKENKKLLEEVDLKFESLEFSNVSFSYPSQKDRNILKNISFKIKKGEKIAIVGESGSGKSTILNLIKKNYIQNLGRIYINFIEYKDIERKTILNFIGSVDNRENILTDSVENNIGILKVGASLFEIKEASKKAMIYETIEELEKSYDTILEKDGISLSTGQKQRISLARIFLKNPEIILLDEAMSGLDNVSEKIIIENMEKYFGDKTIICVTHRLDTIKDFDRIFVMKEGKIIEEGRFEELLNKKEEFYRIYNTSENEF